MVDIVNLMNNIKKINFFNINFFNIDSSIFSYLRYRQILLFLYISIILFIVFFLLNTIFNFYISSVLHSYYISSSLPFSDSSVYINILLSSLLHSDIANFLFYNYIYSTYDNFMLFFSYTSNSLESQNYNYILGYSLHAWLETCTPCGGKGNITTYQNAYSIIMFGISCNNNFYYGDLGSFTNNFSTSLYTTVLEKSNFMFNLPYFYEDDGLLKIKYIYSDSIKFTKSYLDIIIYFDDIYTKLIRWSNSSIFDTLTIDLKRNKLITFNEYVNLISKFTTYSKIHGDMIYTNINLHKITSLTKFDFLKVYSLDDIMDNFINCSNLCASNTIGKLIQPTLISSFKDELTSQIIGIEFLEFHSSNLYQQFSIILDIDLILDTVFYYTNDISSDNSIQYNRIGKESLEDFYSFMFDKIRTINVINNGYYYCDACDTDFYTLYNSISIMESSMNHYDFNICDIEPNFDGSFMLFMNVKPLDFNYDIYSLFSKYEQVFYGLNFATDYKYLLNIYKSLYFSIYNILDINLHNIYGFFNYRNNDYLNELYIPLISNFTTNLGHMLKSVNIGELSSLPEVHLSLPFLDHSHQSIYLYNIYKFIIISEIDSIYNNTVDNTISITNYNHCNLLFNDYNKYSGICANYGYGIHKSFLFGRNFENMTEYSINNIYFLSLHEKLENELHFNWFIITKQFIESVYISFFFSSFFISIYPFIFIIIIIFIFTHIIFSFEFLLNDYVECKQFRKLISYLLLYCLYIYLYINIYTLFLTDFFGSYYVFNDGVYSSGNYDVFSYSDTLLVYIDEELLNFILYCEYLNFRTPYMINFYLDIVNFNLVNFLSYNFFLKKLYVDIIVLFFILGSIIIIYLLYNSIYKQYIHRVRSLLFVTYNFNFIKIKVPSKLNISGRKMFSTFISREISSKYIINYINLVWYIFYYLK